MDFLFEGGPAGQRGGCVPEVELEQAFGGGAAWEGLVGAELDSLLAGLVASRVIDCLKYFLVKF